MKSIRNRTSQRRGKEVPAYAKVVCLLISVPLSFLRNTANLRKLAERRLHDLKKR